MEVVVEDDEVVVSVRIVASSGGEADVDEDGLDDDAVELPSPGLLLEVVVALRCRLRLTSCESVCVTWHPPFGQLGNASTRACNS